MSASSKKMAGIIGGLLVLAAAGYFIVVPMKEKQWAGEIEAAIAALPGKMAADKVEVTLLSKTATITGLKGTTKNIDGSDVTVNIEKIVAGGCNISADSSKGVATLADSLTLTNATVNTNANGIKQDLVVKSAELKGIKGDWHTLSAQIDSKAPKSEVFKTLMGVRIERMGMTGYTTSVDMGLGSPLVMTVDSLEANDMGILSGGAAVWKNMKVNALGAEVLTLESASMKSYRMPNIVSPVLAAEEQGATADINKDMMNLMQTEALQIKGIEFTNMMLKPMTQEAITLKKATFDLDAKAEKITMQKNVQELVLPVSVYSQISPEAAMFAKNYGKPLNFSGSVDAEITQKDGKGDITLKGLQISEQGLGNASLAMDMQFSNSKGTFEGLFETDPEVLLKKSVASFEDKGIIAQVFAIQFAQLKAMGFASDKMKSADDMRTLSADQLLADAKTAGAEQAKVLEGAAKLLKESGKLTITMAPEKPMPIEAIGALESMAPGAVNMTVEFTPAQK